MSQNLKENKTKFLVQFKFEITAVSIPVAREIPKKFQSLRGIRLELSRSVTGLGTSVLYCRLYRVHNWNFRVRRCSHTNSHGWVNLLRNDESESHPRTLMAFPPSRQDPTSAVHALSARFSFLNDNPSPMTRARWQSSPSLSSPS